MLAWARELLRALRGIREGVEGLTCAVHDLPTGPTVADDLEGRVAALERTLEIRMAEAEAVLMRAEGRYAAARAAEERERRLASQPEEGEDDRVEALVAAYEEVGVPLGNGVSGPGEEVPDLHPGMAGRDDGITGAYAMKWGN